MSELSDQVILTLAYIFRTTAHDLNNHCLYLSFKWSSEQLVGIKPITNTNNTTNLTLFIQNLKTLNDKNTNITNYNEQNDVILLIQSLFQQCEYQRCYHILKKNNLKTLLSRFLTYFSLYLSGEKVKNDQLLQYTSNNNIYDKPHNSKTTTAAIPPTGDRDSIGANGNSNNIKIAKNPFLIDIFNELYPLFQKQMQNVLYTTDSNNDDNTNNNTTNTNTTTSSVPVADGYIVFLLAIVMRDMIKQGTILPLSLICKDTPTSPLLYTPSVPPTFPIKNSGTGTGAGTTDPLIQLYREDLMKCVMSSAYGAGTKSQNYDQSSLLYPSVYTVFLCALRLNPLNWLVLALYVYVFYLYCLVYD